MRIGRDTRGACLNIGVDTSGLVRFVLENMWSRPVGTVDQALNHIGQSRPYSNLEFVVKVSETFSSCSLTRCGLAPRKSLGGGFQKSIPPQGSGF